MYKFLIIFLPIIALAESTDDQKVSDMDVQDFKKLVRVIIQETLSFCTVTGKMEGRAKINLAVEGEVLAKLECNFEDHENTVVTEK